MSAADDTMCVTVSQTLYKDYVQLIMDDDDGQSMGAHVVINREMFGATFAFIISVSVTMTETTRFKD